MTITTLRRAGALAATLALAAGTLAATATTASAAGPTGIITGTISQPGGGVVPNVDIYLYDPLTTESYNTYTRPDGTFTKAVPAGTYEVTLDDNCDVFQDVEFTASVPAGTETNLSRSFVAVDPVAPTNLCPRIYPTLAGLPQVGVPLTAAPGLYAQTGVTQSFQWYVDGEAVPGAVGPVYVPTASDVGGYVEVRVTTSKAGFTDRVDSVYPALNYSEVKRGDYVFKAGPQVAGLPILGKYLTASPGALVPGATLSYQWLRNGVAIPGATGAKYRVAKADYQKKISAVITYTTYGYATVVRSVSAPFAAKKAAKISTKLVGGKKKATVTVAVKPSASRSNKGKISISYNGKTLKRASIKDGSIKVIVTGLKKGKRKLTIVYEGRKYAAGTTKSVRVK